MIACARFLAGALGTLLAAVALRGAFLAARAEGTVRVDAALPPYRPAEMVTGTLTSIGASNLDGILQSWATAFERQQPGAHVAVVRDVPLSADGLDALIAGRAQLAPFVREAFPSEVEAFRRKFGYPPTLVCVAGGSYATKFNTHALAIYVNASNPLTHLTLAQLDAIYSTTRRLGYPEDLTRWGQLGLTGEWAARPIHLYGMVRRYEKTGNPPGIVQFFVQRALGGGEMKPSVREIVDPTRPGLMQRPGAEVRPSAPEPAASPGLEALDGIVAAVAADPDGIGYSGFRNRRDGTKTLALGEGANGPFFAGTLETVLHRDYPLSRKVYVAINRAPGEPLNPLVREFLSFALSREGQAIVANDRSGYLPLGARLAGESLRALR